MSSQPVSGAEVLLTFAEPGSPHKGRLLLPVLGWLPPLGGLGRSLRPPGTSLPRAAHQRRGTCGARGHWPLVAVPRPLCAPAVLNVFKSLILVSFEGLDCLRF